MLDLALLGHDGKYPVCADGDGSSRELLKHFDDFWNIPPLSSTLIIESGRKFGTEKNPVIDSIQHRGYRLQKD